MSRSVSATLFVARGDSDLDVKISADAETEYGRVFLSNFTAETELTPAEREEAEEKLADHAMCYRG